MPEWEVSNRGLSFNHPSLLPNALWKSLGIRSGSWQYWLLRKSATTEDIYVSLSLVHSCRINRGRNREIGDDEHITIFWTIVLGIIGSIIGGAVTHMFSRPANERYHPAGLIFSTLGAILVLFACYKLKIHFPSVRP